MSRCWVPPFWISPESFLLPHFSYTLAVSQRWQNLRPSLFLFRAYVPDLALCLWLPFNSHLGTPSVDFMLLSRHTALYVLNGHLTSLFKPPSLPSTSLSADTVSPTLTGKLESGKGAKSRSHCCICWSWRWVARALSGVTLSGVRCCLWATPQPWFYSILNINFKRFFLSWYRASVLESNINSY